MSAFHFIFLNVSSDLEKFSGVLYFLTTKLERAPRVAQQNKDITHIGVTMSEWAFSFDNANYFVRIEENVLLSAFSDMKPLIGE